MKKTQIHCGFSFEKTKWPLLSSAGPDDDEILMINKPEAFKI